MKVTIEEARFKKKVTKFNNSFSRDDIIHLLMSFTGGKNLNESMVKVGKHFKNTGGTTFDGGFQLQGDLSRELKSSKNSDSFFDDISNSF